MFRRPALAAAVVLPALAAAVVLAVPLVAADGQPPAPTTTPTPAPTGGPTHGVGADTSGVPRGVRAAESGSSVSFRPGDAERRARVRDAVRRFQEAGLHLPAVHVQFSDADGCFGHLGVFDRNTQPWNVRVCSDLEFVLIHELGHAWVAAHLDDDDRAAYIEFRELPAWNDPDLHWSERGTEDAAFVLQRVLMTEHVRPDWSVWQELKAAYEQLTGRLPPQVVETGSGGQGQG